MIYQEGDISTYIETLEKAERACARYRFGSATSGRGSASGGAALCSRANAALYPVKPTAAAIKDLNMIQSRSAIYKKRSTQTLQP